MTDVTRILSAIEQGDPSAAEHLLPLVYDELRKQAGQKMAQEKPGQTLQATALVHEAYLRLVNVEKAKRWDSRGHFFAAAAVAMRRILVENARRKGRARHGGDFCRVSLENSAFIGGMPGDDLLALDEALCRLKTRDEVSAKLVELRYFAGMTMPQAAETLGISLRSAERGWTCARAWLYRELRKDDSQSSP